MQSMDYTRWTGMQSNPVNPNTSMYPYTQTHTLNYPYYSQQPQNPNPNPNPNHGLSESLSTLRPHEINASGYVHDIGLRPPGTDMHPSLSSYGHLAVEIAPASGAQSYYQDQSPNWAAKEAVRQYGGHPSLEQYSVGYPSGLAMPPNGTEQLLTINPDPTIWANPTFQPAINGPWRRGPKKTKVVQSAWCEICRIDCNSKDVLDKHKLGKKHKKNVEKLMEANAPPVGAPNPLIGPQEKPSASQQKIRKKAPESEEDLDTKKRKIVESGAPVNAVRSCAICNVVCNSETVYRYHLQGQKHMAMVKKHTVRT